MPRRSSRINEETFNVFEDTDSSPSSSTTFSSDNDDGDGSDNGGGLYRRRQRGRRHAGANATDGGSGDYTALAPRLQRYFKEKGALQFADSHVFVRVDEDAREGEAEAVVLPPLPPPPPPSDIITMAVAPTAAAWMALTAGEAGTGIGNPRTQVGSREAGQGGKAAEKVVRRIDAETAARVAGLRPIRGASAGTTSVDLLNTLTMPVQVLPTSATTSPRRRRRREEERRRRRTEAASASPTGGAGHKAAGEGSTAEDQPLSLQITPTPSSSSSSGAPLSIGTGSHSGPDGAFAKGRVREAKKKHQQHPQCQGRSGGDAARGGEETAMTTRDGLFPTSDSELGSTEEDDEADASSEASDEAYWRQLERSRQAALSPEDAAARAAVDATVAVVPPLRAHVYIEEDNGKFLDHERHAALQAHRAALDAAKRDDEEKQWRRAMRRARRRGGGSAALYNPEGQADGREPAPPPRRNDRLWSTVDPTGQEDPRRYRYMCLVVLQYARRVNVFLLALACGASALLLITATLPSILLELTTAPSTVASGDGSASAAGDVASLRAGSLALLVLLVRLFDAPFFLFLSLVLIVTQLLPLPWGVADSHWLRRRRRRRQRSCTGSPLLEEGGSRGEDPYGSYTGTGAAATLSARRSAFNKAHLREAVRALTIEARQRRDGDATAAPVQDEDAGSHQKGSQAAAAAAAMGTAYTVDPAVSAQLNSHAFALQALQQRQKLECQQQQRSPLFVGTDGEAAPMQMTMRDGRLSLANTYGYTGGSPSPAMGASMSMGASAFYPLYAGSPGGGGGGRGDGFDGGLAFDETARASTQPAPPGRQAAMQRNSFGGSLSYTGSGPRPLQQQQQFGRNATYSCAVDSPSVTFRPDSRAQSSLSLTGAGRPSDSPLDPKQQQQQQQPPYPQRPRGGDGGKGGGGGHMLSAEARRRLADNFLVEGGMLRASNRAAITLKAAERWLATVVCRRGVTARVAVLLQPRLWCLVVCLAMSVVELALLDAQTAPQLLQLLSTTNTHAPTTATDSGTAGGGGRIGYTREGLVELPLAVPSGGGGGGGLLLLVGEPWTGTSARRTFLAIYAVRAAVLLLAWLLDIFL